MRSWLALVLVVLLIGCGTQLVPTPSSNNPIAVVKVSYPSRQEKVVATLYRPTNPGPHPGLVVIHGDFGLTDWVKKQALRHARRDYVVLAVDLYRGENADDLLGAHIMGRGLPEDRVLADLQGAVKYLTGRSDVQSGKLGVLGWDMGAGYALDLAVREPRVRAVVLCHGKVITDSQALAPLNASVLGIFAEKDEGIPPETIAQFRAAMQQANKRIAQLRVFEGCAPGFMKTNQGREAHQLIEDYLDTELKHD